MRKDVKRRERNRREWMVCKKFVKHTLEYIPLGPIYLRVQRRKS